MDMMIIVQHYLILPGPSTILSLVKSVTSAHMKLAQAGISRMHIPGFSFAPYTRTLRPIFAAMLQPRLSEPEIQAIISRVRELIAESGQGLQLQAIISILPPSYVHSVSILSCRMFVQ